MSVDAKIKLLEYYEKVGGEEHAWWNEGPLSNTLLAKQFREASEVAKVRGAARKFTMEVIQGITEGRMKVESLEKKIT